MRPTIILILAKIAHNGWPVNGRRYQNALRRAMGLTP